MGIVLLACSSAPAFAVPPSNDDFDSAKVIGALPYADPVNTIDATNAGDDPSPCSFSGHTIWYRFVAPSDARIELSRSGSADSACIYVFTGSRGALSEKATGGFRMRFNATSGTTYHVMVAGFPGSAFTFSARVAPPPPANDDFNSAAPIGSLPFTGDVDLFDASPALDDPSCPETFPSTDHNVWYAYAPLADARVDVRITNSPSQTSFAACIFTGSRGALVLVQSTRRGQGHHRFNAVAGTTYFVLVAHSQFSATFATLTVKQAPPPPPHDAFATATVIGGLPYLDASDNSEAMADNPDDPSGCGELNSVWYSFTPTRDMQLTPTVTGDDGYLPGVAPFRGSAGALIPVGDTSGGCPLDPFEAKAGTTYHFMVGSRYTLLGGPFTFSLTGVPRGRVELAVIGKTSVVYGGRVTLKIHLVDVADTSNRVVSLYSIPSSGPKKLVRSGAVNANGDLVVTLKPLKNTKFQAQWAAEAGWLPGTSPTRSVKVKVITTTTLVGFYGRSGACKLYHSGNGVGQIGTVKPKRTGAYLVFIAQKRQASGAWRQLAKASFRIRANGSASAVLGNIGTGAYRVRNLYPTDASFLGDASAWQCVRVT